MTGSASETPRRRGRFAAILATVLTGMLGSGLMVWQGTAAVFSATTTNPANSWTLGSVSLVDDDTGAALFAVTGLTPTGTGANCIAVTYNGDVATTVKLYGTTVTDPDSVAQYLDLTVQEGTGGGYGTCAGFTSASTIYSGTLADFSATSTGYASGVGTWAPSTAGTTRVYRFAYSLNAATPNNLQGKSNSLAFQWESRA